MCTLSPHQATRLGLAAVLAAGVTIGCSDRPIVRSDDHATNEVEARIDPVAQLAQHLSSFVGANIDADRILLASTASIFSWSGLPAFAFESVQSGDDFIYAETLAPELQSPFIVLEVPAVLRPRYFGASLAVVANLAVGPPGSHWRVIRGCGSAGCGFYEVFTAERNADVWDLCDFGSECGPPDGGSAHERSGEQPGPRRPNGATVEWYIYYKCLTVRDGRECLMSLASYPKRNECEPGSSCSDGDDPGGGEGGGEIIVESYVKAQPGELGTIPTEVWLLDRRADAVTDTGGSIADDLAS